LLSALYVKQFISLDAQRHPSDTSTSSADTGTVFRNVGVGVGVWERRHSWT